MIKSNILNGKDCKTHETKISTYTPAPFPFSAVSKANKRILCKHLTQTKKNWGYNCSFSNMSTFEAETSFQLKQWYSIVTAKISHTKQNKKESRKLYFRTGSRFVSHSSCFQTILFAIIKKKKKKSHWFASLKSYGYKNANKKKIIFFRQ